LARLDKKTDPYEIFDIIESQTHRLEDFIKDIIDYSRISRVGNHFSKIDFNELIKNSLEDNKYVNGFEKVDVSLKVDGEYEFHTDTNKMKIIFNNIISNAIKYYDAHKPSSYLQIIISKSYKKATIEIIDNGMGIKKERIPKLFTMFYRATDTGQGSGLGLFIIKEALNTIKGEISINSIYGKGTTIKITIPNKL
jgi:signal transduction histidine kinase